MSEYILGGHTASVNVVRWGGAGPGKSGVLYTASSDRSVKIWNADKVLYAGLRRSDPRYLSIHPQGTLIHTLKDHAHWVTTLTLNTDFALRTGPYDHLAKEPNSDEEGQSYITFVPVLIAVSSKGTWGSSSSSPRSSPIRRYHR